MSARVAEYLPGQAATDAQSPTRPGQAPRAVSLASLQRPPLDGDDELLRHRFLCRGGGLLLVGPTGIGKSSLSMQCMLSWALGQAVFGIEPVRPIKSLLIQAENDDGDLAEMRDGVVKGLELTAEKQAEALARILVLRENTRAGDTFFAETVRPLLEEHRPDLIWIDPALAYLAGESNAQEDVGEFLRRQLNPLLDEFRCAAVIVHHTNKPAKKGESGGSLFGEAAYLGAGSAEWANWARAVLALRATPAAGVFELHAGKRGGRLRWVAEDGETRVFTKTVAHAKDEGEIYWRPATAAEIEGSAAKGNKLGTSEEGKVLSMIPAMESVSKAGLIERCALRNIGRDKAHKLIKQLIDRGDIEEKRVPRDGKRPEVHLVRANAASHQPPEDHEPSLPPGTPPPVPKAVAEQLRNTRTEAERDVPDLPGSSQAVRNIRNRVPALEITGAGRTAAPARGAERHSRSGSGVLTGSREPESTDNAVVTSLFHPFSFTHGREFDELTGEMALQQ